MAHISPKKSRFADEMGERYGEIEQLSIGWHSFITMAWFRR